jgi:hypothetical protein
MLSSNIGGIGLFARSVTCRIKVRLFTTSKAERCTSFDVNFPTGLFLTRPNGIDHHGQIFGEYLDNPISNEQHGLFTSAKLKHSSPLMCPSFVTSATGINDLVAKAFSRCLNYRPFLCCDMLICFIFGTRPLVFADIFHGIKIAP